MKNLSGYRMVALLMTDIEGSTRLWERAPELMPEALRRHDELAQRVAAAHNGYLPRARGEGDSGLFVFPTAAQAVEAAAEFTVGVAQIGEGLGEPLNVRCAVHAGEVLDGDEDLYGGALNRCARIRSLAWGGQVLVSDFAQGLARPHLRSDITFQSLGRFALRDLAEPEHLHQLAGGNLRAEFPPLASLDRTPNNLPAQLTPLVGRGDDIRAVGALLEAHRQVTLLGPGGAGKTRLALEVAAGVLPAAPDAIWFVDLAAIDEGSDLLPAMLRASGKNAGTEEATFLTDLAGSSAVWVLDNCEQIVEPVRQLAAQMLQRAPKLRLIATSRHALRLPGERIYPLAGLSLPEEGMTDLNVLRQSEAVRLLVDRARQRDPFFEASTENAAAIGDIVRRLDGLPLAIELAAPRLGILSPAQLAARLTDDYRALRAASGSHPPRHRTIEASIEWSFGSLTPDEALFFVALAHFIGGWTLEAAEAIHSTLEIDADPLDLLDALRTKSMIVAGSSAPRMRMLVPLRAFGMRQAEANPRAEEAFLAWAQSASTTGASAADRGLAFAQVEAENLRAALARAMVRHRFDVVYAVCRAMYPYWYTSGQLAVGQSALEYAIKLRERGSEIGASVGDSIADLLDMHGVLAWARGELETAEASVTKARQRWQDAGNDTALGRAQSHLGFILSRKGDFGGALRELTAAYKSIGRRGKPNDVARAATNLGNVYLEHGKYVEAEPYFEEAVGLARKYKDPRTIRTVTHLLAEVALRKGERARAQKLLSESFRIAIELQDVTGAADLMLPAAELLLGRGDAESAALAIAGLDAILATTGQALDADSERRRTSLVADLKPHLRAHGDTETPTIQPLAVAATVLGLLEQAVGSAGS